MKTEHEHWPSGFAVGDLVMLSDVGDMTIVATDDELVLRRHGATIAAGDRALCVHRVGKDDAHRHSCAFFLAADGTIHVFVLTDPIEPRVTLLDRLPNGEQISQQSLRQILARYSAGDFASVGIYSTFSLGTVVATPGAVEALTATGERPVAFLTRHRRGDWGDVSDDDRLANNQAVEDGSRILSAFHLKDRSVIWIITEADRSATTILLPDEY